MPSAPPSPAASCRRRVALSERTPTSATAAAMFLSRCVLVFLILGVPDILVLLLALTVAAVILAGVLDLLVRPGVTALHQEPGGSGTTQRQHDAKDREHHQLALATLGGCFHALRIGHLTFLLALG